jgi:hypothetical protein
LDHSSRIDSVGARIKDAAMRTVAEDRLEGLNVRAICIRAETSEAEFYRRWPDHWAALLDAFDEKTRLPTLPDTGRLLDDLVLLLNGYRRHLDDPAHLAAIFYVMAEIGTNPVLREKFAPGFEDRRRRNLVLIERAIARGELSADVDGDAIMDAVLRLGLSWMGAGQTPADGEVRLAVGKVLAAAQDMPAPRRRISGRTPPGAYRLYLFETPAGARGRRVAEVRAIECSSDSEGIAEADALRGGGYAELWKDGDILKIFEPD